MHSRDILNEVAKEGSVMKKSPVGPILLLCMLYCILAACDSQERQWQKAYSAKSIAALEKFKQKYPTSAHHNQAGAVLDSLYYAKALDSNTIKAYDDYLQKSHDGAHAEAAREKRFILVWDSVLSRDKVEEYENFLKEYPASTKAREAIIHIKGLRYRTVKIGNQMWMAENLCVGKFRNGEIIPEASTKNEWADALRRQKPAWCYYQNDINLGAKYGRLYNWYALVDKREIAPEGWHVPSESEFEEMLTRFGGTEGSSTPLTEGGSSGFSVQYAGSRKRDGNFEALGARAGFFCKASGGFIGIQGDFTDMGTALIFWKQDHSYRLGLFTHITGNGYSVRCVHDK